MAVTCSVSAKDLRDTFVTDKLIVVATGSSDAVIVSSVPHPVRIGGPTETIRSAVLKEAVKGRPLPRG